MAVVVVWRSSLRARLFKSQLMIVVGTLVWGHLGVSTVVTIRFSNKRGEWVGGEGGGQAAVWAGE